MIITLDLRQVPPVVGLEGSDDFTTLKVCVARAEHATIHPDELRRLAGPAADDPTWEEGFQGMLAYAAEHGWTDGERVRVHLEDA